MKCRKCGQDKLDYHFFAFKGWYVKEFFANPLSLSGQCFDCNGPYKCLKCGEVKPASDFRIGGRVCVACKNPQIINGAPVENAFAVLSGAVDTQDGDS